MTRIEVPNSSPRRKSSGRFAWALLILLVVVVGGCALWSWLTLSWAYAEGERAGVLQKFVRVGWFCKTQEGEIALYYGGGQYLGPSQTPQLWDFSVRDSNVASDLSKAVGHRVQLHYTEHPGVPTSCFAKTRYFVDKVTVTDNPTEMAPPMRPATLPPDQGSAAPSPPPPATAPSP